MTTGGLNYKQKIPYSPENSGSASVNLGVKNYSFNYNFIYTGWRYSLRPNITENYLESWYTHDISIGRTFHYGKAGFKVLAEVNNLFNQQYEVVSNFPMPGRSFRLTITLNNLK